MPAPRSTKRPRGLAAIQQAREDRAQKRYKLTPGVGYAGAAVVIVSALAYKFTSDRRMHTAREDLTAKQQEVVRAVGADWVKLRDQLEGEIVGLAKSYAGDLVDPTLAQWDFTALPGVYFRIRVADATDPQAIREYATNGGGGKRDGFSGCLLHPTNDPLLQGEPDAGAFPEIPWTLGQAYSSARVTSEEWSNDVREAKDRIRIQFLDQELEEALKEDIPRLTRIVKRAQFFLVVLDEDVPGAAAAADAGTAEEALQLVAHPARIALVDLRSGSAKEALRLRRTGGATLVPASEQPVDDPHVRDAAQRQANNCALARQVEAAITPPKN
jgi:hypothetical protein